MYIVAELNLRTVSVPGAQSVSERVVRQDLFVLAVGGKGPRETGSGSAEEGAASYRSITVEVTRKASLDLGRVLAHVGGNVRVEVMSPDAPKSATAGQVLPGVLDRLESAGTSAGRSGGAAPAVPRGGAPTIN